MVYSFVIIIKSNSIFEGLSFFLSNRNTLRTNLLPQAYNILKESIRGKINATSLVALTTDGWTSLSNHNYCVTAHLISSDGDLKSYLLECFGCSNEPHTAEYLKDQLTRVISEWHIKSNVCAGVSDNADNIVKDIKLGIWTHIACFALLKKNTFFYMKKLINNQSSSARLL